MGSSPLQPQSFISAPRNNKFPHGIGKGWDTVLLLAWLADHVPTIDDSLVETCLKLHVQPSLWSYGIAHVFFNAPKIQESRPDNTSHCLKSSGG